MLDLEANVVFLVYLALYYSDLTKRLHRTLPTHAVQTY